MLHTKLFDRGEIGCEEEPVYSEDNLIRHSSLVRKACPNAKDRMSIGNIPNLVSAHNFVQILTEENYLEEIVETLSGGDNVEKEDTVLTQEPSLSSKE